VLLRATQRLNLRVIDTHLLARIIDRP